MAKHFLWCVGAIFLLVCMFDMVHGTSHYNFSSIVAETVAQQSASLGDVDMHAVKTRLSTLSRERNVPEPQFDASISFEERIQKNNEF